MPSNLLLFTGPPESGSLDWSESGLLDAFSEPVARFAGLGYAIVPGSSSASSARPSWRSVPLEQKHLATGLSQGHGYQYEYQGASFFTTSDIDELSQIQIAQSQGSSPESTEQVLSQFYEQSYAIHEDVASSQIEATSRAGTSLYGNESSSFASSSADSLLNSFSGRKDIPVAGHLTNLKDIPNAAYLSSIYPQTMTVNLITGIISIPPPRRIKTRRGADVDLIEVLVGDETKSGFAVNFWLSSSKPAQGDMRTVLSGLRPQDIVLMRNVALSSFRGKVYGQSLRKETTKVHLLYRKRIDKTDGGGCYKAADLSTGENSHPQVAKTTRVREWVLRFVGAGVGQTKGKGRAFEAAEETLPPDTQ